MSFPAELKKLSTSTLSPYLSDLTGQVWLGDDGVIHSPSSQHVPEASRPSRNRYYGQATPVPGALADLTVSEMAARKLCSCASYSMLYTLGWQTNPIVSAIMMFEEARTRLASASKVTKATSASAIQTRIRDLGSHASQLRQLSDGTHYAVRSGKLPEDVLSEFDTLASALEDAQTKLKMVATSDAGRSKVEDKLKKLMVPKRFQSQSIALDESLCLVGISPAPRNPSTQVAAAIEAYAIRNDNAVVLCAPAFVYSFLLQQLFPKGSSDFLVVSAPAPEDEIRETAAGIWDPEGESSLACMQAAIDTARVLAG